MTITLIKSLRHHFEARAIEWGMAGWAITWGVQALLVPEIFINSVTKSLIENMSIVSDNPSGLLGLIVLLTGLFRATALFINGMWHITPLVRILTSAVSGFVVANIIVSSVQGAPTFATVTYMWLFLADCFSAYRAARDYLVYRVHKPTVIATG